MAGCINRVTLMGNVGRDPEIRSTQDGRKIANLSVATSEAWTDKTTGDRKSRTEWHRVTIYGGLADIVAERVAKGTKVYLEGALQTRKWTDPSGQDRYSTDVVLVGPQSRLIILGVPAAREEAPKTMAQELNDEVPF